MAQADGRVVIETKLDNTGMIAGEKEVEESLRRMAQSIKGITKEQELALQKQIDSFAKLNTQYSQQEQKVKELQDKLQEYAETKIPTEEYKDLEKQIDAAYEELDKLVAKQEEYKSIGVTEDMMPQSLINELDQAGLKVGELEEKLLEMQETGSGFTLGIDTDRFAQMSETLNIEEQKLLDMNNRLGTSYETITTKIEGYANSTASAAQSVGELARDAVISGVNKLGSGLKNVASHLVQIAGRSITNGIKKLTSAISGAGNSAKKAGVSFKQMLGYGLGFRSLYSVFSKLKSYISEGLDSLSEYSEETKASLTNLDNSLTTLKNALAVAFAPILNTIVPILTKFINILTEAANYVSMFFSMLQGKSTYTAAVPVQEEYTSSMEDTASATESAAQATEDANKANEEYLSGLDEINKFTESSALTNSGNGGSGTSGSPGSTTSTGGTSAFETRSIESALDFSSWGEAFDKFLDYLLDEGIPALENGLTKLAGWINSFADNLYEMFTFPGVLDKVKELGTDIAGCFNDFVNMIDWDKLGRALGAGLNLALNFLTSLIYGFDWQNLGAKLAEFINGAIDEIDFYNLGQFLWSKFKIALETLAGFLENLNMPRVARSLSDMIIGWFDGMIETISSINWDEIGNQIQRFVKNIKWGKIGDEMGTALNSVVEAVREMDIGTALGDVINGFFTWAIHIASTFDWIGLGDTISEAINNLLETTDFHQIGQGISTFVNGFLDTIIEFLTTLDWEQLGRSIVDFILGIDWLALAAKLITIGASLINGLLQGILGVMEGIGDWIDEHIFQPIVKWFKSLFGINSPSTVFAEFGKDLIQGLFNGIESLIQSVLDIFTNIKNSISQTWDNIKSTASTKWNSIKTTLTTTWNNVKTTATTTFNNIKTTISGVWDNIKTTASSKWSSIKTTLSTAWNNVKTTASTTFNNIKTTISGVWDTVKTTASTKWDSIKTTVSGKWDSMKTTAGTAFNNIKTTVSGTWDTIKTDAISKWDTIKTRLSSVWGNMKTACGSAFEGMKNVIKAPINSIIGFCNKFISGIVTAINNVISALNKVSVDIPNWVPGVGGQHFGISIPKITTYPQISYLASGAVIPPQSEFLAVLGDQKQGNNIEAPESLLRKIVREETANNNNGGQYEFTAQINRRTLFDEFIEEAKLRQMQTGKNPLAI